MTKFCVNNGLHVSDFYDEKLAVIHGHKQASREAFEKAGDEDGKQAQITDIQSQIFQALGETDSAKIKIANAEFDQFDSANVSHANYYWTITLEGDWELLAKYAHEYYGLSSEEFWANCVEE